MTPAEEFAALIDEAKDWLAIEEASGRSESRVFVLLRKTIATWEKIEQYADAPTVGPTRRTLARRFRESALAATNEPKP